MSKFSKTHFFCNLIKINAPNAIVLIVFAATDQSAEYEPEEEEDAMRPVTSRFLCLVAGGLALTLSAGSILAQPVGPGGPGFMMGPGMMQGPMMWNGVRRQAI